MNDTNTVGKAPAAGHALPERLQQLFRHTLREGLLNPLIHIVQAHRAQPADPAQVVPPAQRGRCTT